jgi:hypothetical protein
MPSESTFVVFFIWAFLLSRPYSMLRLSNGDAKLAMDYPFCFQCSFHQGSAVSKLSSSVLNFPDILAESVAERWPNYVRQHLSANRCNPLKTG